MAKAPTSSPAKTEDGRRQLSTTGPKPRPGGGQCADRRDDGRGIGQQLDQADRQATGMSRPLGRGPRPGGGRCADRGDDGRGPGQHLDQAGRWKSAMSRLPGRGPRPGGGRCADRGDDGRGNGQQLDQGRQGRAAGGGIPITRPKPGGSAPMAVATVFPNSIARDQNRQGPAATSHLKLAVFRRLLSAGEGW